MTEALILHRSAVGSLLCMRDPVRVTDRMNAARNQGQWATNVHEFPSAAVPYNRLRDRKPGRPDTRIAEATSSHIVQVSQQGIEV